MGSAGYLCVWICAVGDGMGWDGTVKDVGWNRGWYGLWVGFWIEGNG